jgi:hypothetical protein
MRIKLVVEPGTHKLYIDSKSFYLSIYKETFYYIKLMNRITGYKNLDSDYFILQTFLKNF